MIPTAPEKKTGYTAGGLTRKALSGCWVFKKNQNQRVEALQALILDKDGTWQEIENQTNVNAPANVMRQGAWRLRDNQIVRVLDGASEHDAKNRFAARIDAISPMRLQTTGPDAPDAKEKTLVFEKYPTMDAFVEHTRKLQAQTRKTKIVAASVAGGVLLLAVGVITAILLGC